MTKRPVLYSFRRCPYAIRARMGIRVAGIEVEIREVLLAKKPEVMLAASAKGTVPVLVLDDGYVMDESLDIMLWSLKKNDPDNWLMGDKCINEEARRLIEFNDNKFKQHLDHYKYADRFPEQSREIYRHAGEEFLQLLDAQLGNGGFLFGEKPSITDVAIFPFMRQFAWVDKPWFDSTLYIELQKWLRFMLESRIFLDVMQKYPRWQPKAETIVF